MARSINDILSIVHEWRAENEDWFPTPLMTKENPDTLTFAVCETAELLDAELHARNNKYVRNAKSERNVSKEVGDTLLMLATLYSQVESIRDDASMSNSVPFVVLEELVRFWHYGNQTRLLSLELCMIKILGEYPGAIDCLKSKLAEIEIKRKPNGN